MKKTMLMIAVAFAAVFTAGAADQARLLRFPTTNGRDIVFSYAGDLYKVPVGGGQAMRLTSHVGYEMFPKFSPDGQTIAFTGQYDGNTEVYTIPVNGGEPLRVTYTATNSRDDLGDRMGPNNIVMGWTPEGGKIVYRNRRGDGFSGKLYLVEHEGGLSEEIPLPEGGFCSYSPDGRKLAYNRVMREFRTWKYYKGGMADDIWIYDAAAKSVTNISNNDAQDIMPMWIGDDIFYISDRDRTMNIFVYNTKSGQTEKVTNFTEYDVKFPSANNGVIVFENGGYIYKMNASDRRPVKVDVTLAADNIYARSEVKNVSDYVSSVSVSHDGARLAVTARGEVFDVPATKGVTRNITRSAGAHERDAEFSPDGKHIAYISDASGESEIWMQPSEGGDPVQMTKNNGAYIRTIMWSPDSKKIAYIDMRNRINLLDVASKRVEKLVEDPAGEPRGFNFSPDGNWLTYTRTADNEFSIVYVYNIAQKKEYPVTDKWYSSSSPAFSEDGKYIMFSSQRDFNPVYGSMEWNHIYTSMGAPYIAILSKDTPSPLLGKDPQVNEKKEEPKKDDAKKDGESAVTVNIDIERLADRIVRLPVGTGRYYNFYGNNDRIYYYSGGKTKVFNLKTQKEDEVADGMMFVAPGNKKAIISNRNKFYVVDVPSGKASLGDQVDLSNMVATVDYAEEWPQIFNEAWRIYRDGFYVENMHGVDWNAMKEKYAVMLPYVKTRLDLNYLIGEMIGELNVGHAYVNPGELPRAPRLKTGMLGAEVSRDRSGFFRINKIIPGASWSNSLRSPLTDPGIDVKEGEYIVAIDGVPTNSVKDMYQLLVGKAGVLTELKVNSSANLNGARKVVITPIEEEESLYHYNWVQDNIRKVEKASGGRIGYIYIPDMGPEGLNEFSRYFYAQLDKEGLIIDDRANGGGNVSPMILERLAREPYRVTMRRGSNRIGTVPDAVQVGPKVALINKYSASDGDLFPWGFRALGLGKLIGTRTWGGIVGISGSMPYMDGTDIRVPFFTSFNPKTGDWIIENHGVDPDILIDNDPIKEYAGEDQQLNRAIEEVMKELQNRQPLPKTAPAPRVWNK